MSILLALILLVNILTLALVFFFLWAIKRFATSVGDFVTPESEGKSSKLGDALDAVSMMFARAITAQIKTTLMTASGNQVRAEKAIQGDLIEDSTAIQAPLLGVLVQQFPHLRKSLRRNPALAGVLMSALEKFTGKVAGPGNGARGAVEAPRFQL